MLVSMPPLRSRSASNEWRSSACRSTSKLPVTSAIPPNRSSPNPSKVRLQPPSRRSTVTSPSQARPSESSQPPVMTTVVPSSLVAGQAGSAKLKASLLKPSGSWARL